MCVFICTYYSTANNCGYIVETEMQAQIYNRKLHSYINILNIKQYHFRHVAYRLNGLLTLDQLFILELMHTENKLII